MAMNAQQILDTFTLEDCIVLHSIGMDININDGRISEIVTRRDEEDENGRD